MAVDKVFGLLTTAFAAELLKRDRESGVVESNEMELLSLTQISLALER